MRSVQALAAAALLLLPAYHVASAGEPKQGGILRVYHRDSPGSASIHEGATYSINIPFMPVFNNLVMFKQDVPQNSVESIVPDLAESWAWSGDGKKLTFKLRQGVKWHDGKPFTSADVKCTFDMLMGKSQQKFRQNPRKSWYDQVDDVTTNGDFEASFNLKRPQPALLSLLASGYTPVYPCHVSPGRHAHQADRHRPVQVRRVQGQRIDQAHQEPRLLQEGPAASRRHRIHHHYQPFDGHSRLCLGQVRHDVPDRGVDPAAEGRQDRRRRTRFAWSNRSTSRPTSSSTRPLRRSTISIFAARWRWRSIARPSSRSCSKDRRISAAPCSRRRAACGRCRRKCWRSIPGYGPDINANREEARKLMQKAGYGPDKRLAVKVSTRNIPIYRDPAIILIDQIKSIYIDGELDVVDTAQWFSEGRAQGLFARPQSDRQCRRRSRPVVLRELFLRLGAQLYQLLQQGNREAVRPAVGRDRRRQAQEAGLGDRQEAAGGRGPPDHLPQPDRVPAGSLMSRASPSW